MALDPDTDILMKDHTIKKIKDIKIGEKIIGDDNSERTIMTIMNDKDQMYLVEQSKGMDYIVNSKHILVLKAIGVKPTINVKKKSIYINFYGKCHKYCKDPNCSKVAFKKITKKCENMKEANDKLIALIDDTNVVKKNDIFQIQINDFINTCSSDTKKSRLKGYKACINIITENVYEPEIDPYLIGLWLGDGTAKEPELISSDIEIEKYLYSVCDKYNNIKIKETLFAKGNVSATGIESKNDYKRYRFANIDIKIRNPIRNALNNLYIYDNKHIPDKLFNMSEKNKYSLLAGLIDSDGYLGSTTNNGNGKSYYYEITQCMNVHEKLFNDIVRLIKCLGFSLNNEIKVNYEPINRIFFRDGKDEHSKNIIRFRGDNMIKVPSLLQRKNAFLQCIDHVFFENNTSSLKITPVKEYNDKKCTKYISVSVDGNKKFLLKDGTVVHNL